MRAFFRREAPGLGLWGWDVWWRRGLVPEGGRYGKGQGGGFLSSERPGAEPQAEREGVEGEERRVADTAELGGRGWLDDFVTKNCQFS